MGNEFYVIKLLRPDGVRGYVIERAGGKIHVAVNGLHADVKQFDTEKLANEFIREHKLDKKGAKAYVRSNIDVMSEEEGSGAKKMEGSLFYIERNDEKLFYDASKEGYYFKRGEAGFPAWPTRKAANDFARVYNFPLEWVKELSPKNKTT